MSSSTIDILRQTFEGMFGNAGKRKLLLVESPGRTEIAGNHTDHEGGCVIAGAVDRYVEGIFSTNDSSIVRIESKGYGYVELHVSDVDPRVAERGTTTALVRGILAQFVKAGFEPRGFNAVMRSDVLGGSGLSSSAAFELEIAQAVNRLWAYGALTPEDLARISQRAEREWFGKPCGLMDQAAVALGGIQHMDFRDPSQLHATRLDFDFASHGYAICLVAVGADHAALIDDYAAVPAEMQAVAREFGKERLSEVAEDEVVGQLPMLRARLGDRAVLRALHYCREQRLVEDRARALSEGNMDEFLHFTRLSGSSSAMYLQNVSVAGASQQPAMVALALADEFLRQDGACRIHGGGFGGTIQAFVPFDRVDAFVAHMDAALGSGSCGVYNIDAQGTRAQWM